jgi:hypothetical protein
MTESTIDLSGIDREMAASFVVSRYFGKATIQEKMASSHPEAIDPFEPLATVRGRLEQFASALKETAPNLTRGEVVGVFGQFVAIEVG